LSADIDSARLAAYQGQARLDEAHEMLATQRTSALQSARQTAHADPERTPILRGGRRERQFEPVPEAGWLWAVWSDVDWLDTVWS
jgi:hypothetical protein